VLENFSEVAAVSAACGEKKVKTVAATVITQIILPILSPNIRVGRT
jgi:hypothetical protein